MSAKPKIGITYGEVGHSKRPLKHTVTCDFVSVCDGITFGSLDGKPFHTGRENWANAAQIRWAEGNAEFFKRMASDLTSYARLLKSK